MAKPSRIREIKFAKKLTLKSKIKSIYTAKIVRSGTSARINCKLEFLQDSALIIIIPAEEKIIYSKK